MLIQDPLQLLDRGLPPDRVGQDPAVSLLLFNEVTEARVQLIGAARPLSQPFSKPMIGHEGFLFEGERALQDSAQDQA